MPGEGPKKKAKKKKKKKKIEFFQMNDQLLLSTVCPIWDILILKDHSLLNLEFNWAQLLFFFLLFRAAPETYGSSQARGQIGATAAGRSHSHSHNNSNAGSELHL